MTNQSANISLLTGGTIANLPGWSGAAEALFRAAREAPEVALHFYDVTGRHTCTTYAALLDDARRAAAWLEDAGLRSGDYLVIQCSDQHEMIRFFWACLITGIVAVPVGKTEGVAKQALEMLGDGQLLIGHRDVANFESSTPTFKDWPKQVLYAPPSIEFFPSARWHEPPGCDAIATVFLTSGSTGTPKGVVQTHDAIICREAGVAELCKFGSDIQLNWMPLDHAAGILMAHFRGVYLLSEQVQVATEYILEEPLRWLDLIDAHRVTYTWAPQFAYTLLRDLTASIEPHWDLSCVRYFINAGEMVNREVLMRLSRQLEPCGLATDVFLPAWGMAETCSGVVYHTTFLAEESANSTVPLGVPIPGVEIAVMDDAWNPLGVGESGHLVIRGRAVLNSYHRNDTANAETIGPDGWFRTGDIAHIAGDMVVMTGRNKQVLIVNGLNLDPSEVESVIEELAYVEPAHSVVWAESQAGADGEIIVCYTPRSETYHPAQIEMMQNHLGRRLALRPSRIIPVRRLGIPRTNLGKKQRTRLAQNLKDGTLENYRLDAATGEQLSERVRTTLLEQFSGFPITVRPYTPGSREKRLDEESVPLGMVAGTWKPNADLEMKLNNTLGVRETRVWTSTDLPAGLGGVVVAVEPKPGWESIIEVVHERVAQVLRPYNFAINDVQIVSEIATCDSRWLSSVLASTLGTASSRRSGNPTRVIHVDALLPYPESDLDSVSEVEVPWIVFTDNGQTALALCKDAPASVTVVRSCPEDDETAILRASGIRVVHVNLYSPDPFSEVIAEMNQAVTLINLWTAEESPHDVIRNEGLIWGNLMRGVAGLGEALRTFAQQAIKMNRALVVTRNASDVGAQSSATLHAGMSAFVRAARAEGHPINHLDLVEGADLIQAVQDELRLQPETDRIVTGAGQRYVRALRRAELTAPTEVTTRRLSSGVVVVVGGTGGVGQWLVTVLLARYEADVLVLGRRPYHQVSSILDDVRNRSGNRGRLRYMEMDLNESTDISLAITSELDGKALAGIFYLAGAIDEVLITDSTLSRTRENYGASIISIHRIGELVKQNAGAFLAVFGSARSLSPGVTVSDYVAATEHAVRYAAYLQKLGVHAVGVSWSVWNETGMSRNLSVKKALAHRGLTAFDVLEGVNALLGALESNLGLIYYGIEDRDLDFPKVSELQPPAIQIVTDAPTASILVDRANEIDAIVAEAGGSEYIVDVLDSLPRDRFGAIDDILIDARADILRGTVQIEPPADESEARVLDVCTSVLGIPSIGVTENLFNLGADSITVIRLLGSIRNQLGLDVSHEGFYRCPTVRGLASNLKQLKIIGSVHIDEAENQFPLSPQQRRQWVLYNLNPSSGYYNNTITVTVTGTIVEPCLKAALVSLIERHEILRTRYVIVEDIPLQQVLPISGIDIDIPVLDMRHLSEFSQNQQLKQLIDTSGARPLNISSGLPLRLAIARTGQDEAVLVITIHHIASDGWSMRVILEELQQLYDDILAHGASRLPALKSQYRHHVADILAQENTDNYRRQLDYWITEMAGQSSAPPLSAASYNSSSNKESSAQNQNAGGHFTLSLDGELTANLKRLAHELDSSMYVVTLAAYAVLHARLTTDNHVRIGTLIAGRHRPETELLVGFFVNTLPVDFTVADDMTVRELVKLAKAKTITMQDNQDVQFDALVEAMQPERISDSNPLFQVLFVLQNAQLECAHGREAEWNLKIHENDTAKFDFSVQVFERPRAMDIVFEYRRDLLDAETVARWGRAYSRVLERFCAEPDTRVSDIDIVGKETGSLLFAEPAKSLLPSSLGVALAKTVRDFGERIALSKGGVALQYNELWERAGRYAGFLAENGVSEGSRVAVVARRTPEVIIALIALIRLGAVYVPLRPNDPDMRHAAIMADSGATVLLDSTEETRAGVAPLPLDEYSRDIPVEPEVTLDNPIYIMYTSGSTGTPKGVVVTHENVLSLAYQPKFIKLSCSDTTLQTGSLTFDASTFEVWGNTSGWRSLASY